MQALTAAPRTGLDPALVRAVLYCPDPSITFGADLLDVNDQPVAALLDVNGHPRLRSCAVSWDSTQDVQRTATMLVRGALAWGRDRVRPWQTISSRVVGASITSWAGVFLPTLPSTVDDGSSTVEYQVTAFDKTWLLRCPVGDSWATLWSQTGQTTTVAAEARRILAAAGWTGLVAIDPAATTKLLPQPMVWPLDDGATTYLRILNDILTAGGFAKFWVDEAGTGRITPIVLPSARTPEWTFDATAARTGVGRTWTRTQDITAVPNQWRFINSSMSTEPLLGQGLYAPPDNASDGPSSIAAKGPLLAIYKVDAADQAALVVQGDAQRAADMRAAGTRDFTTRPNPLLGHDDLYALNHPRLGPVTGLATKWGPWDLSGADIPITVSEVLG